MGDIKDGSKRGLSCKRMLVHFKAEIAMQSMSFHASNPLGESWKYKGDKGKAQDSSPVGAGVGGGSNICARPNGGTVYTYFCI